MIFLELQSFAPNVTISVWLLMIPVYDNACVTMASVTIEIKLHIACQYFLAIARDKTIQRLLIGK